MSSEAGLDGVDSLELSEVVKVLTPRWFAIRNVHQKPSECLFQSRTTLTWMRGADDQRGLEEAIASRNERGMTCRWAKLGLGRRIAKSKGGVVQWKMIYRSQLQPAAMLDASNNIIARYVYGEMYQNTSFWGQPGIELRPIRLAP